MPSARDVGQYILSAHGPMTAMKLQKLVYYSQAWSVVWDDDVLFPEDIEAWKNGPVVRDLWEATRGQFRISEIPGGDAATLNETQQDSVNRVLDFYAGQSAQWLSDLTHMEDPWKNAYAKGQNSLITPEALVEYYSSILPDEPKASAN
ncbi:Panacea domain-containing protein [Roseospira navarrensis]|uniref:DUF4065 domain-containing protein n=1 Tax=Roseospira navarrensis TaxID=140058 RepID=A0A7X1ZGY7_9PROT|nr:type II toxin-antitoxin system antitoxin SocA domain-containing protein [Roseospira navarrensis]MQX38118.1 DUF4065 domain-containing protein [Roseospira navarrensis]